MKRALVVLVTLFSSLLISFAQEQNKIKFGIGINLNVGAPSSSSFYTFNQYDFEVFYRSSPPIGFLLPIIIAETYKLEPSFGLFSYNSETTPSGTPGSTTSTRKLTSSKVFLSLGIHPFFFRSSSFKMYAGPTFGLGFTSSSSEEPYYITPAPSKEVTEVTETDWMLSGVLGSEYFPIQQLSFGGEIRLTYTSFGNPERTYTITPAPQYPLTTSTVERNQHSWETSAFLTLRWYFVSSGSGTVDEASSD